VRVTTAFNKMLDLPGATVATVAFTADGLVLGLRRRRGMPVCPCGKRGTGVYDRSVRRWRHLDWGVSKVWLEAEIRRLDCRRCGRVRTEQVPWARPRARHSRDFEDVVAWLAQHTDKTTITKLLRSSWETVDGIVARVVGEQLNSHRLEGLLRIGVDEVSYRKGHRFLTVVADHDQGGRVVWAGEGRNAKVLEDFYDELGEARCAALQAISLDLGGAYQKATDTKAPHVRQCADPFHMVKLANEAIDKTRRLGLEPGPSADSRQAWPRTAAQRRSAAAAGPGSLGQAQPVGAGERSRRSQAQPARGPARAAPLRVGALPVLAVEGRSA
jgi:transposase